MYTAALVTLRAKSWLAHGGAWIPSRITVSHGDLCEPLCSMTPRYGFPWKQDWGGQLDGMKSRGLGEALTQTCTQCGLKVGSVGLYAKSAMNHRNWHVPFSATRWSWVRPADWEWLLLTPFNSWALVGHTLGNERPLSPIPKCNLLSHMSSSTLICFWISFFIQFSYPTVSLSCLSVLPVSPSHQTWISIFA